MKRVTVALVAAVFVAIGGWGVGAAGQAPAAKDENLTAALLEEVRGLRQAMERMASAGPRIQLALGRLQLQEQRVNTMIRRQDDIKAQIDSIETEIERLGDALKRLDDDRRRAADPDVREHLDDEGRMLKSRLDRFTADLQRLQGEEIAAAQAVATEQSRWMDINARLEALERELQK